MRDVINPLEYRQGSRPVLKRLVQPLPLTTAKVVDIREVPC